MTGRITRKPLPVWWRSILLILLAGLLLFLTFNRHSKSGIHTYHSEIWGDKAGYYVYLPAVFIYSSDAARFPQAIDSLTGNGFQLDLENHKILTKYTCGVAVMQIPFFLAAHAITGFLNAPSDGFSAPYHRMIDVAAIFYLMAGLICWYHVIRKYFTQTVTILTIAALFLGTNLYYYAIDETGMSHVYSFFLFSFYLFSAQRLFSDTKSSLKWTIITGITAALIVLVRPVNGVFLPVIIFLDITSTMEMRRRISFLLAWKNLLILMCIAFLIFLPQWLYWHSTYGKFLIYTYQGEGFTNLTAPRIAEYLFSTNNGLLLYSPILLIGFYGILWMLIRHKKNRWLTAILVTVILYLFSSWWNWYYGCGYGNRSFTEYLTLLALPFGFQMNAIWCHPRKAVKWSAILFVCILILLNLKMIYSWDGCWYGTTWDWERFFELLFSAPK